MVQINPFSIKPIQLLNNRLRKLELKFTDMKKRFFALALIILSAAVLFLSSCYVGYGYGHPHRWHEYRGY
jgi:hypothetical protein